MDWIIEIILALLALFGGSSAPVVDPTPEPTRCTYASSIWVDEDGVQHENPVTVTCE